MFLIYFITKVRTHFHRYISFYPCQFIFEKDIERVELFLTIESLNIFKIFCLIQLKTPHTHYDRTRIAITCTC